MAQAGSALDRDELRVVAASQRARRTVALIGANSRWDEGGQLYWEGETEECINGRTVADGGCFGVDVSAIVERLLGKRQSDGGWNCERARGPHLSSFATTISVLEGLLAFERQTGGTPGSRAARKSGETYLLERQLFPGLRSGEPANPSFLFLLHPNRWRYDILRGLDHFRRISAIDESQPDRRLGAAVEHVRQKRRSDGRWNLNARPRGRVWYEKDDRTGQPSF